jgi:hypothetical protein
MATSPKKLNKEVYTNGLPNFYLLIQQLSNSFGLGLYINLNCK